MCVRRPRSGRSRSTSQSSLSADGRSLICNLGTRNQGTAEFTLTGVVADGIPGSQVAVRAQFAGRSLELPKIAVVAAFAMDAKFDKGAPTSAASSETKYQFVSFPFSLSHARNASPGPTSVSYDLTIQEPHSEVQVRAGQKLHSFGSSTTRVPLLEPRFSPEQSTRFPGCTLEKVGPTLFRLTLSELEYSNGPSLESNGQPLPSGMNVIAAGEILLQVPWKAASQMTLVASAPPLHRAGRVDSYR